MPRREGTVVERNALGTRFKRQLISGKGSIVNNDLTAVLTVFTLFW